MLGPLRVYMTTGSTLEATTPPDKAADAVAQPSSSGQHVSIEANASAMSKTQCLRLVKSDAFKAESSEGESSDEEPLGSFARPNRGRLRIVLPRMLKLFEDEIGRSICSPYENPIGAGGRHVAIDP
jgi:hypothetical protein